MSAVATLTLPELFESGGAAPALHAALQASGWSGAGPRRVRVERCWSAGESFRIEWSLALGGRRRVRLWGSPLRDAHGPDLGPAGAVRAPVGGLRGVCATLPDVSLLAHTPDRDPLMPQLAGLLEGPEIARAIEPYVASPLRRAALSVRLLGYKPGRRAALACRARCENGAHLTFMAKTFRDQQGARLVERQRTLMAQLETVSDGRVTAPAPIGYDPPSRLALFAWAPGQGLAQAVELDFHALERALDAVGALHQTQLDGLPAFRAADDLAIVQRWVTALARIRPRLAHRAAPLCEALAGLAAHSTPPGKLRVIHRDFYEKQVILDPNRTVLLDLDTLALGDPAQDVGNFLAHLALHRLGAGGTLTDFRPLRDALLKRYESVSGPLDRRAIRFYGAASLIRGGALHGLRSLTRRHSAAMWALAREWLTENE